MTAPTPRTAISDHLTWLRLRGMRPNTVTARRWALGRLTRSLGDPLTADEHTLDAWQQQLHLTDLSRSNEVTHVIGFYRWALLYNLIDEDPTRLLVRPKLPRRLPRPIGENALTVAIATAPPRVKPWLVLAAYAGLRAHEIALLERSHVQEHADPPVIAIMDGKGGKQRVVPAAPVVIAALLDHGLPHRGVVFPRGDGLAGPNTAARVSQLANRHLHQAGITATLHQLRHRFGSELYRVSVDLRLVQEVMGHGSPATTAGYVAWSSTKAAAAVAALT